jgi:hypothetical protein
MKYFLDTQKRHRLFPGSSFQYISLICILIGLISSLFASHSYADSYVTFLEIWTTDPAAYNEFQAKITFMGDQEKIIKTLAFSAEGYVLDLDLFVPFQYPDANYSNDSLVVATLELSASEFQKFVNGIRSHPELHPLGYVPEAIGAIALLRGYPPQVLAWEHMCTESELRTVYSLLFSSIDPDEVEDLETVLGLKRASVGP